MMSDNPYRDAAIASLATRKPACIGWRGSSALWVWFGNAWLFIKGDLEEKYPDAFLPGIAFDLLEYHNGDLETYRGYPTPEAAMADLARVRRILERPSPGVPGARLAPLTEDGMDVNLI